MRCEQAREIVSAHLDGEASDVEVAVAQAHLDTCATCRGFAARAEHLSRIGRVRPADDVPDLSPAILAALRPPPAPPRVQGWVRLAAALLGVLQIGIAVMELVGIGTPALHLGREVAAWNLGLGAGMLAAAWQPRRAAGLLPVAAVAVVTLLLTAGLDLAAGHAHLLEETLHLVELGALGALWLLWHRASPGQVTDR